MLRTGRYLSHFRSIVISFSRSEGEIHFSLLAMVTDRKMALEKRIAELANSSMDVDGKEEELQELRLQVMP